MRNMDRTFCLGEVRKWETLEKFDDATFIVADHEHPGILYAYVDEDLSARIARTLIKISLALGPLGGLGPAGLSVNTPLRAALATGFQYAERPDDYDAWIAALEDVAAFLRA